MLDEQIRIRTLELLADLSNLAAESGMKKRIRDSLQELWEKLDAQEEIAEASWEQIRGQLEDILRSMEKQVLGEYQGGVTIHGDVTVSQDEVRQRIVEIWNKSNASNMQRCTGYKQNGIQLCQKLEHEMADWGNAEANARILTEPGGFAGQCTRAGHAHDYEMTRLAECYISEMNGQYVQAMNRIRNMITSIDNRQVSITAKDIYEKWECRQQERIDGLKKQQAQADSGGHLIMEFGHVHEGQLQDIVKKVKKLQTLLIVLPVLLVLLFAGIPFIKDCIDTLTMSTEDVMDAASEAALAALEETVLPVSVISESVAMLQLAACFAAAAVYAAWVLLVRKQCRRQIIQKTGRYIQLRLQAFFQGKTLEQTADRYMVTARENTLKCYDQAFRALFADIFAAQDPRLPANRIKEIRLKWNKIRNAG